MATIRLVPSTYYRNNSSYVSVTNANNMYTNTDSTTYASVQNTRNSTSNTYYCYLRGFNFGDIPSDAEVTGFTIKIKANESYMSTSSSYSLSFRAGDPVFIYRKYTGNQGKPGYKSCITTYCIATKVVVVKSNGRALVTYEEYRRIIGNKSVYDDYQLKTKYDTLTNLTVIELLYYGYFGAGNNVNWVWLNNNGCWPGTHPMNLHFSREQFEKVLKEGKVDVSNVIID